MAAWHRWKLNSPKLYRLLISTGKVRINRFISFGSFKLVTSHLLSPRAEGGERKDLATPASFTSDDDVGSRWLMMRHVGYIRTYPHKDGHTCTIRCIYIRVRTCSPTGSNICRMNEICGGTHGSRKITRRRSPWPSPPAWLTIEQSW